MASIACRFCRSGDGEIVLDLGHQPASELFPPASAPRPDAAHPLRMWLCARCGLAQLADELRVPEDPQGIEPAALAEQRVDGVRSLVASGLLPPGGSMAEFPSPHGGTWTTLLTEHGLRTAARGEAADVVLDCCFGLMHEPDQRAALQTRVDRLTPRGVLLVEYHSLAAIAAGAQWNALRHGHFAYYSTPAMREMLREVGLTATEAWSFPLYGGTVLLAASRRGAARPSLEEITADELAAGVRDAGVLRGLQASVSATAAALRDLVTAERSAGRAVLGYGAASRAVSLLRMAGLDASLLHGVADAAAAKHGTRMPGTDIPVISPGELVAARPDVVLLFVSDLLEEVRAALPEVEGGGGRWVDAGSGLPREDEPAGRTYWVNQPLGRRTSG